MTASKAQLASLRAVAERLGPLREEVVFVGGMIRGLLITDLAATTARPTDDIDVVAAISSTAEYYVFADRLRQLGFQEDTEAGAPLCRWLVDSFKVDVMPDHENVLGFSNRWYPSARSTAMRMSIGPNGDDRIQVIDAPHFLATKLVAFRARGKNDYYHHDMEDLLAVVDGRVELLNELVRAPEDVRRFVEAEVGQLLQNEAFRDALPGHLPGDSASQARLPILERRLRQLSGPTSPST